MHFINTITKRSLEIVNKIYAWLKVNLAALVTAIGVIIAALTYIYTIQYKPDELKITLRNRVPDATAMDIVHGGAYNLRNSGLDPVIGPIAWNIEVFNPASRTVTITDFKVYYTSASGLESEYSAMKPSLSSRQNADEVVDFPIVIPSGEAKAYVLRLYVPIHPNIEQKESCLSEGQDVLEIERCFGSFGSDLFGNPVKIEVVDYPDFKITSYTYKSLPKGPRFFLEFETGDGTKEGIGLGYFGGS